MAIVATGFADDDDDDRLIEFTDRLIEFTDVSPGSVDPSAAVTESADGVLIEFTDDAIEFPQQPDAPDPPPA